MNKELKEQAHKEFDENYKSSFITLYTALAQLNPEHELIGFEDEIKSFIDSLIDKTVQMTEERIVGKINLLELSNKPEGYEIAVDDIISLITNKSDIKVMEKKDFIKEIEKLCRKYNLSISHEDSHGAFIINEFNESDMEWLKNAQII